MPQAIILDVLRVCVQETIFDQLIVEFTVFVQALLVAVVSVDRLKMIFLTAQV